ncbi:MAG TPA: iron-containing alcohol dehydrogenase [Spirochaetota bacterium]|nr:iron-containing alcohol dehydrogenase [Spirochaetota bacterium]HOL57696.1 iron-containing alcohol dehydrogenase [Spirochaetota bacterium]HPP05260.1 iron-containing alcohol dehydrogenase [Spirochaetota bacterium]
MYFEFYNPVKICAGDTALSNLSNELEFLNCKKCLIITDNGIEKSGLLKYVIDSFYNANVKIGDIFTDIPPDSDKDVVNKIADIYREKNCDSIVAVGGGSVIDTAKGVNILVSENSSDLMKFCGANILKKPLKPFIVIPTTSGTGSEVTVVAVIANRETNSKMLFLSPFLLPNVAIIDPVMTLTLPPFLTAATAMDALTHAIEAYICIGKNMLSDAYSFSAIKLLSKNLINVVKKPDDRNGRLNLALASTMAGIAFSNSMVGLVHTIGHSVGAICHIHHGVAMNILLPYVLEYNLPKVGNYIGELLLPLVGEDIFVVTPTNERPAKVIEYIRYLQKNLFDLVKLPRKLSETGKVLESQFEEIANLSLKDASLAYNPEDADIEDIIEILKKAF